MSRALVLIALLVGLAARAGAQELVPLPRATALETSVLLLPDTLRCALADSSLAPLLDVLDYEFHMRTGGHIAQGFSEAPCRLETVPSLNEEAYRLAVGNRIVLAGGSYRGVAMESVTLMQAIHPHGDGFAVPRGTLEDAPAKLYRGVLMDVAQLFDAAGAPLGHPWVQRFRQGPSDPKRSP